MTTRNSFTVPESVNVTEMVPRISGKQLSDKTAKITAVFRWWRWITSTVQSITMYTACVINTN